MNDLYPQLLIRSMTIDSMGMERIAKFLNSSHLRTRRGLKWTKYSVRYVRGITGKPNTQPGEVVFDAICELRTQKVPDTRIARVLNDCAVSTDGITRWTAVVVDKFVRDGGYDGVLAVSPDEDMSWQNDAACRAADTSTFYEASAGANRRAKDMCARCPVKEQCLDFAIRHRERGIWGGMTRAERKRFVDGG